MARFPTAALKSLVPLLLIGTALAQEPPAPPPPVQGPPAPLGATVPIDGVAATVNDVAILVSQLRAATQAEQRTRELELGRPLVPGELGRILANELQKLVDSHALAQSAKTLGILPPDRVEQIFQEQLREEQENEVRTLGSWLEFSRSLKQTNRTWETFYLEQRLDKMYRLAEELTVWARLQNSGNLFITPQMMRDYYRRQRDEFVHDGAAMVSICAFVGTDAEQVAKEAAAIWRTESITSQELEKRLGDRGARALSDLGPITAASRESQPKELVDFALGGPKNQVHDPVQIGATWRVWKVIDHRPAEARQFDDPAVQAEIRRRLTRLVHASLRLQALGMARDRTHVWYAAEFRDMAR